MEKKYYHDTYFQKIMQMAQEHRFEAAIYELEKYLKNYPYDVDGYVYYANILIRVNHLDEAESILNTAKKLLNKNISTLVCEDFLRVKILLLCCQKKYEEAYSLFQKNIRMYYHRKWIFKSMLCFLKKQLDLLNEEDYVRGEDTYLIKQILSYDEYLAIEHIKEHQTSKSDDPLQFVERFPLEKTYYAIRAMLPTEKKYIPDAISNSYIFKYDASGHVGSKLVDFFEVITLLDSSDIITMYPYENKEKRDFIDITPLDSVSLNRKRVSQIDRFNQRYGKK